MALRRVNFYGDITGNLIMNNVKLGFDISLLVCFYFQNLVAAS